MQDNDRKIDNLLKRNTDQQLAGFDWDRLHAEISDQLDRTRIPQRRLPVFRIVATTAAAAALLIGLILWKANQANPSPDDNKQAANNNLVKSDSPDHEASNGTWAKNLQPSTQTLIDTNGNHKNKTDTTKRISIIRTYKHQEADTGPDRDSMDLICLL